MNSSISEFGHIHYCKEGFQSKFSNRIAKVPVLVCRDKSVIMLISTAADDILIFFFFFFVFFRGNKTWHAKSYFL